QSDMTMEFVLPEVSRVIWSGRVVDEFGIGLEDISVDFRILLTGHRAFVTNNSTDSLGNFSVAVPTGNFNVLYTPPKGARLTGHRQSNVSITADTSVGTVSLSSGWFVRVDVSDPQGVGAGQVNLDFVSETLGEKIFTPRDITDQLGTAVVVVPTDTYTILATPPASSALPVSTVEAITISSDTTLTFRLTSGSGTDDGQIALKQNYPNPFNGSTIISYELKVDSKVSLRVYNLLGQHVKTLASGSKEANTYNIDWDGTNKSGQAVASGVYFYRLETSQAADTRHMVLVK
ncbi:MAG: T9SS type A sorting domain-containing protein, partial [Candidatus Zixiibacteriota bacterium]